MQDLQKIEIIQLINMKPIKTGLTLLLMIAVMTSFSQCSSSQKLQKKAPIQFGDVYCQSWVAGIQGGGSGINIFIPVKDSSVVLDSVYFRGKVTKLKVKPQNTLLYIGYFKTKFNQKQDVIMSSDTNAEYTNKMPEIDKKIPFDLKDDECVISYIENKTIKYFKINNVTEKQAQHYPSAPPNKRN